MSTVELRQEAKALIDTLSGARLRVASEFLAFVKHRETDAATLELLAIPGFEKSFARGMKDIKAGRTKPWRKVRAVYRLELSGEAERFFKECDRGIAKKLTRCFKSLESNPCAGNNIKALKGRFAGAFRYRIGDYRVIYTINDRLVRVFIVTIATRGDAYE